MGKATIPCVSGTAGAPYLLQLPLLAGKGIHRRYGALAVPLKQVGSSALAVPLKQVGSSAPAVPLKQVAVL